MLEHSIEENQSLGKYESIFEIKKRFSINTRANGFSIVEHNCVRVLENYAIGKTNRVLWTGWVQTSDIELKTNSRVR